MNAANFFVNVTVSLPMIFGTAVAVSEITRATSAVEGVESCTVPCNLGVITLDFTGNDAERFCEIYITLNGETEPRRRGTIFNEGDKVRFTPAAN